MIKKIFFCLKRETSNTNSYIPYIDGLRTISFLVVILDHFKLYYQVRIHELPNLLSRILGNSGLGVFLFFAISGFLITKPFAESYINNKPRPNLKKFYIRRLTRLEPPYIILLTLFYLINIIVIQNKGSIHNITNHYLASLFYLHNIIFDELPLLNGVLWTLEIEIQFYLLAPFIAYIFKLKPILRRSILIFITLFWHYMLAYILHDIHIPKTLLSYINYFLVGVIAVDFYISYNSVSNTKIKKSYFFDLLCLTSLSLLWLDYFNYFFYTSLLFIILYLSTFSKVWIEILKSPLLTILGGMSYSVYMLHQRIIYAVMPYIYPTNSPPLFNNLYLNVAFYAIIIFIIIIIISSIFYILVEKPTMKKDWYKFNLHKKR